MALLTNSEFEIFQTKSHEIAKNLNFKEHFNIIELGAGDGLKTAELIKYLTSKKIDFTYKPIDISQEANDLLSTKMKSDFPNLKIEPETGDYFQILERLQTNNSPSLLLFIGSNIGNYLQNAAKELIKLFHQSMKVGDKLLIGVDLKKNPNTILNAYKDPHGITKRFNLNLLTRINRELGGDFDLSKFDFFATYQPETGEVRSYIVSLIEQEVELKTIDRIIQFKTGECIWTELSKKYDLSELENFIQSCGFKKITHFIDSNEYFTDSLFEKIEFR